MSRSAINSQYSFEVEFCIPSFFSAMQSFPFAASYHLIFSEMLSISPQQAYSFVVDFLNNSIQPFLLRLLSISFVAQVVIFCPVLFIPLFQFFRRHCVVPLGKHHSIFSSSCSILSMFSQILPKSFQSYSFLISF